MKTIKKLADALNGANIGMNADSEDYERLAKAIAPKLEEFFGEEIFDDTRDMEGMLYVFERRVIEYAIPLKAKHWDDAIKRGKALVNELIQSDELDKYKVERHRDKFDAEFEWDLTEF